MHAMSRDPSTDAAFGTVRLRLDPWAAEYHTAYLAETRDEARDTVDVEVERSADAWQPLRPEAPPRAHELVFLDGSRRVDARVLLEDDAARAAFGVIGTYGVGAVHAPGGGARARFDRAEVRHVCAVGSGRDLADFGLAPHDGRERGALAFEVVSTPERDVDAVVRRLQRAMLDAEGRLAARLRDAHPEALIVCDGPRPLLGDDPLVVGYLKTIHDTKVGEAQLEVARTLEAGQRSPLYLVETGDGSHSHFEWFLRLRDPRPWLYSLAGMVRLQAYAGPLPEERLEAARALADWSCVHLPRFASRQHQDPRAPQQLLPVRGLEAELGRRMGSSLLVRRRITRYLSRRAAAAPDASAPGGLP